MNDVSAYPAIAAGLKKYPDAVYSRQLAPFMPESGNVLSILNHVDDTIVDNIVNVYVSGYIKIRLRVGGAIVYDSKPVVYKNNLLSGVYGDIFCAYKMMKSSRRQQEMIDLCDGIMAAMKEAASAWMRSDALDGEFNMMQIARGGDFRLTRNDVIDAGSYIRKKSTALSARKITVDTAVRNCVGSYINEYGIGMKDDSVTRYFPRMRDNMDVYIEWEKTQSIYNNG